MPVSTQAKVVAAVGITSFVVAFIMIAAFFGYLYFIRDAGEAGVVSTGPAVTQTPRPKRQSKVPAEDITNVEFSESEYSSIARPNAALLFGNVNPQNNWRSSKTVTFSSDGTATRVKAGEKTVNGTKISNGPTLESAAISTDDFMALASVLTENDFVNEENSRHITSLPITKVLTITHKSGVKIIKTGNMDKDTPEITEILAAFRALEQKTAWKRQ